MKRLEWTCCAVTFPAPNSWIPLISASWRRWNNLYWFTYMALHIAQKHFGHEDVFVWSHVTCSTFSYLPSGKDCFDLEADYVFIWDLQVPKINPGRGDMKQFQTICYCLFSDICLNERMQSKSKIFKYHHLIDMEILPDHTEVRSVNK